MDGMVPWDVKLGARVCVLWGHAAHCRRVRGLGGGMIRFLGCITGAGEGGRKEGWDRGRG